jgi:DNA replication protein DnaC
MSNTQSIATTAETATALGLTVAGVAARTRGRISPMPTSGANGQGNSKPQGAPSSAPDSAHSVNPVPAVQCRVCGDLGWVRSDVPVGHPDFGRAIRCVCKTAEDRAVRAKRAQAASNLSGRLLTRTFETFDCNRSASAGVVCALLRQFIETPDSEKGWVVLLGNRGTGKTHLLAAVANALMARGESALYVVVPDFLDYLRAGYDSDKLSESAARRMEDARNAPVLLLDDLGVEKRSPWTDEQLYRLFNHRYNEGLPTVIASNVPLGVLEPRIASRLQDASLARLVMLAGEDQRVAGAGSAERVRR